MLAKSGVQHGAGSRLLSRLDIQKLAIQVQTTQTVRCSAMHTAFNQVAARHQLLLEILKFHA